MSKDFEQQLRDALRPVDPEEGFEERVMARIAREPARRRSRVTRGTASLAIAASMASVAILGAYQWQEHREQRGQEARRQLLEALRVTGENLDVAYQAVNRESPPPPADDGSGA